MVRDRASKPAKADVHRMDQSPPDRLLDEAPDLLDGEPLFD